jgi:hypothetical protein
MTGAELELKILYSLQLSTTVPELKLLISGSVSQLPKDEWMWIYLLYIAFFLFDRLSLFRWVGRELYHMLCWKSFKVTYVNKIMLHQQEKNSWGSAGARTAKKTGGAGQRINCKGRAGMIWKNGHGAEKYRAPHISATRRSCWWNIREKLRLCMLPVDVLVQNLVVGGHTWNLTD